MKWKKAYRGPFKKAEAELIVKQLKESSDEQKNSIVDAGIRRKRGSSKLFDVYIKTTI